MLTLFWVYKSPRVPKEYSVDLNKKQLSNRNIWIADVYISSSMYMLFFYLDPLQNDYRDVRMCALYFLSRERGKEKSMDKLLLVFRSFVIQMHGSYYLLGKKMSAIQINIWLADYFWPFEYQTSSDPHCIYVS